MGLAFNALSIMVIVRLTMWKFVCFFVVNRLFLLVHDWALRYETWLHRFDLFCIP